MNESWYSLSNLQGNPDNIISANAFFPADSPWFSGHFPGDPIVPGVAQLSIIFDVIKKCYDKEKNATIVSIKKTRFKYLVKPEELINILITPDKKSANTYSFQITAGDKTTCSGIITLKEID